MRIYFVASDDSYAETHKRDRLSLWAGAWASEYVGEAYSLPKGAGYMVTLFDDRKVRVSCPSPRSDANYTQVDQAINEALNATAE